MAFLLYPFYLLEFWYKDVLLSLFKLFKYINSYAFSLFSVRLLLVSFFKPLKNEYRQGLVLFSVFFGIFIKSFFLGIVAIIFLPLLVIEAGILLLILGLPIGLLYLVFA